MPGVIASVRLATFAVLSSMVGETQPRQTPGASYPSEKEIALGKSLAAEVERSVSLLADPVVVDYLERLGDSLVRASGASFPVTIKVTDDPHADLNVLPGGFLYFSSGLIAALETETELAGVMAHAVAHIAARHGSRLAAGPRAASESAPLVFAGGWGGICTRLSVRPLLPVALHSYARAFEDEADWLAVEYLSQARYDPRGLVSGFWRLQARGWSTSAVAESRAFQEKIEETLRATSEHVVNTSAFEQVRARLKAARGR